MLDTALPSLLQHCHALPLHLLQPRQPVDTERWNEAWADALGQLHEFASHGYYGLDMQDLAPGSQQQAWNDWRCAVRQALRLPELAYTRGLPLTNLEALFEHVLHCSNEFASMSRSASEKGLAQRHTLEVTGQDYPAAVQLLALPVLLERQELIPHIVQRLLDNQCDRLLDYLSAAACDKTEAVEALFCPVPYAALTPFFEQLEVYSTPLLAYLQQAYPATPDALSPASWTDIASTSTHWAWEVAALVVLYDLNDNAFAAHPRYPSDLVAFARQRLEASYPQSLRA